MLKNYFKIALRNILRHKAYSLLNISGLAIGMSCSILILLWVQNELSYDRFHSNALDIYRLTSGIGEFKAAVSPVAMGPGLQKEMPEIKSILRLSKPYTHIFEVATRKFEETNVFYADSNFLSFFSFPLIKGSSNTAIKHPNGILITEAMAKKYFGSEEALGKTIKKDNQDIFTVTGVLANTPTNSHLQVDFILPISFLAKTNYDLKTNNWGNFNFYTYVQFNTNTLSAPLAISHATKRIHQIYQTHNPDTKIEFLLQPLVNIHLHSNLQIDLSGNGNIQYVNIFIVVAFFILAVACINFMNLATARSARRAKEVGLRKVVGAKRHQLILQFLGESMIISFLSLIIAIGLVFLVLPAFNLIAQKELSIQLLEGKLLLSLFTIAFITGIVSGSYPALFLSGFRPVKVLKGKIRLGSGNLIFRNGLVVTQFVFAIILLAGTAVAYKQLNFIKNKNLGFEKANLLYIPMTGEIWGKQQALRSDLQQNTLTSDFSIISDLPINLTTGTVNVEWEGRDPNQKTVIPSIDVDERFIDVFKMEVLSGRSFSTAFKGDSSNYVINETLVHIMGLDLNTAVGKSLSFGGKKGHIIGVVKDFNFKPLQYSIDPLVIRQNAEGGIVVVRAAPGNTESTIKALEKIYHSLNPAYPFNFNFIDNDLNNQYRGEQQMGQIFNLFSILAVFISCLGLYGLSAFMAEQRTKEIGVRKVLGASVFNVVHLLSGKFTRLILLAIAIAVPISWIAINSWLQTFAFRVDVSWVIFLITSIIALLIAFCTICYESVKAAISNPIKSLRAE